MSVAHLDRAWRSRARTAGALALLGLATPVNLVLVGSAWVTSSKSSRDRRRSQPQPGRSTVLLTGGKMSKALHLARAFHRSGHRVVLTETARYRWTAHQFSRCVDAFHLIEQPASAGYAPSLLDVVKREAVDVVVPVCAPASSVPDAEAHGLLDPHCEVVHPTAEQVRSVDDKYRFFQTARELGLDVPDTHRVTSIEEALEAIEKAAADPHAPTYVLKSIAYDPVHRLDLTPLPRPTVTETEAFVRRLPISDANPWILQEFVVGQEYCTHGTVRAGRLSAYVCCRSSAFQLSYAPVDHPRIRSWVEEFVAGTQLTGQLSFDLIEQPDGRVVAIECNPRPHSAITLFNDWEALADAYLADREGPPLEPPMSVRETYWLHHETWQLMRHPRSAPTRLGRLLRGRDAVLDSRDPLPFLLLYHLHLPSLLIEALRTGRAWLRLDPNIGKLVEAGGD